MRYHIKHIGKLFFLPCERSREGKCGEIRKIINSSTGQSNEDINIYIYESRAQRANMGLRIKLWSCQSLTAVMEKDEVVQDRVQKIRGHRLEPWGIPVYKGLIA